MNAWPILLPSVAVGIVLGALWMDRRWRRRWARYGPVQIILPPTGRSGRRERS